MKSRPARPMRIPQYLICLFFLLCQLVTNVHAQVRKLYAEGGANELRKFSFYSPTEGYVAYRDWIGYTTDSGRTFSARRNISISNVDFNGYSVNLTFGFSISGVKAFNRNSLLAYGDYGAVPAILYSSNGGSNWKLVFHSQFDPMMLRGGVADMVFPQNNTIGYAVDPDRILKTTDGGVTWQPTYTASGSYFTNLEAVDNNTVFAICNYINTKLVKTTNAGVSWSNVALPAGRLNYAQFVTASKGWVSITDINNKGGIYTTIDGGSSWILQNDVNVTPFSCSKMKFIDNTTGYALGGGFTIFKTIDGGRIWEQLPRDNNYTYLNYSYNDLQVLDANQFWVGGGGGLLEISTNGGGQPIPGVFFEVDTTGYVASGIATLNNYSRTDYTYEWFVNGVSVGTGYNATYTHNVNHIIDTIRLVASNGVTSNDSTQYPVFFPPVVVSSFTPATAAGGTVVTITGNQFSRATQVRFGGEPALSFSVLNDYTIKATVGSGASGPVTVSTPKGTGTLPGFTYIPPPVISSFMPGSAKAGTTVTITGSEFNNVTAVTFGGVAATSFTVVSPTEITAVTPSGGSGDVQVKALGGTASQTGYIALPDITAFTPTSGTRGAILKITGTSLTGITSVTAGGTAVQSFTINSSTSISAIVASGSTGDVVVSKPGGTATTGTFNWYPKPAITSFAPKSGTVGTTVVITGTDFDAVPANNTVLFGSVKATVLSGTASSLTVSVPAGTVYERISVTSHLLTAYSPGSFMVTFPNGGAITTNSFDTLTAIVATNDEGIYGLGDYTLADFDGDGKVDVILDHYGSSTVKTAIEVYRNTSTVNTLSFAAPVRYELAGDQDLAVGDIDGDGKPDLLVNNWDYYTFSVIRNTSTPGTVSFGTRTDVPAGFRPGGMVIGDIDLDGKPEVAITNYPDSVVSVFRNVSDSGYISFMPRVDLRAYGGYNVLLNDMDEDGLPDLIVPSSTENVIAVLKNTSSAGTIAFAPAQKYQDYYPSDAKIGDVDNDGKPDVVFNDNYGSRAGVYRNQSVPGNISLAAPVLFDAFSRPAHLALGDMDGDGALDIATSPVNHVLTILKNTSSPGMVSYAPKVDYDTGLVTGRYVQLCDFNNDGKPDAAIASRDKKGITFYINKVKREPFIQSFTPAIGDAGTTVTITGNNFVGVTAVSFGGVAAASFTVNSATSITAVTGAGATGDIAVTNAYGTGVHPGFSVGLPPVITSFTPHAGPVGTAITINGMRFSTALNGNTVSIGGVPAVVTSATATSLTITAPANLNNSPITVTTNGLTAYANRPFVTTFPGADTAITTASFATRFDRALGGAKATSDLDGDGKQDLIITGGNGLTVARNTSTPGSLSFTGNIIFPASSTTTTPAVGDVDGDGKPDVVLLYASGRSMAVYRNTSTPGSLSFEAPKDIPTINAYSNDVSGIVISDVDGDGRPEIMLTTYSGFSFSVFRNLGSPGVIAFASEEDYLVKGYPTALTFVDIDGDGLADVLTTGNSYRACVFRNVSTPGKIAFAARTDLDIVSDWPENIKAIDLDGDDKPEIIVQCAHPKNLVVFRNTSTPGNFSFQPVQQWSDAGASYSLAIGDLDGDGKPDIVIGNESNNTNFVYKNISTPGNVVLGSKLQLSLSDYPWWNEITDMDGDGQPEILAYVMPNVTAIFRNLTGKAKQISMCANRDTTFTSNITGSTYQWQQNTGSGFVNISNNKSFTGTTTAALKLSAVPAAWNSYQYRCLVDGAQTSLTFIIHINGTAVTPSVTIAGDRNNICQGEVVTFTATPVNEGATPVYQWKLNNTDTGKNANTFVIANLKNNDQVQLSLTNSDACATPATVSSNVVSMKVNATIQATVTIAKASDSVCSGMPAAFTATVTNGGTSPAFQWRKNGAVTGTNSDTYIDNTLRTGDSVRVRLISNAACAVPDTVFSNTVRITTVTTSIKPVVSISGNTSVEEGESTDLTAVVTGGGATPVYQWQDSTRLHGWQSIGSAVSSVLTYTPGVSNDKVRCMVASNAPCASPQTVTSAPVTFTVRSGARVTPNPVTDNMTVNGLLLSDNWETLEVADMNGGNKLITQNIANQTSVTIRVGQLPAGQYLVILVSRTGDTKHIRFMKM